MRQHRYLNSFLQVPAVLSLVGLASIGATMASAHDGKDHCAAVVASVEDAGFSDGVAVECSGDRAIITSDTYPDHDLMTGIVGTNEQVPVPAEDYAAPIPLNPILGDTPQTRDAALGVAVNGVRDLPRVPPLTPSGGGRGMEPGVPPRGGVENLVFTQEVSGLRSMDYSYQGQDYYIRYAPAETAGCYLFETKAVTNSGSVQTGEVCR